MRLLNTFTNFIVFILILDAGVNYQVSGIIGFLSGAILGFFVNRKFTFDHNISTVRGLLLYFLIQIFSLTVHVLAQWSAVEIFVIDPQLSQIIGVIPSALVNFVLLKYLVFKETCADSH